MVSPVLAFAIYMAIAFKNNTTLDTSRLFTSLSLILLLTQPLFYVFLGIEELMSAIGCFERIGAFLGAESRGDHRLVLSEATHVEKPLPPSSSGIDEHGQISDEIELVTLRASTIRESIFLLRKSYIRWRVLKLQ